MRLRIYKVVLMLGIACVPAVLRAQTTPVGASTTQPADAGSTPAAATPPGATPAAATPADTMLDQMLHPDATKGPAVSPTTFPSEASLVVRPLGYKAPGPPLLREGSEIYERAGRLKKVADSPFPEFVFESDSGFSLPPLGVLPNLKLMSMETLAGASNRDLRFTVTGTLTEYKGRNYILLDAGDDDAAERIAAASQKNNQSATASPTGAGAETSGSPTTKPTSADEMLNQMLTTNATPAAPARPALPKNAGPAVDATSGSGAIAPGAPVLNVMREGSLVLDRTGRLTRTADGQQWEFTFDADGSNMQDPPAVILPNLKLSAMEGAVKGNSQDIKFRVSGIVTEYRGRDYILLQKAVAVPQMMQQF